MLKTLHHRLIFLALCLSCLVRDGSGSAGPVFINPASQIQATPQQQQAAPTQGVLVTQTVYGFLDFTTTIGNTVMVFSPQSAAPAPAPPPEASPAPDADVGQDKSPELQQQNTVIETKPAVITASAAPITIKPSKTEKKPTGASKKLTSVVHVVEATPPKVVETPDSEIKPVVLSSQVNVVEDLPSIVNIEPQASSKQEQSIITKVEVITGESNPQGEVPVVSSKVEVYQATSSIVPEISSVVEIKESDEEPAVILGNNIGEPEYDFLSRQPSEVVEETYKVINLKPSAKSHHGKARASTIKNNKAVAATKRADSLHPTGLVTKLGGTVVKDGVTTVHETSVIGTFISGKYAQVLQSTSHVYNAKQKINPSPTLRILKTAAPSLGKKHRHLEPTPAVSINEESLLVAEVTQNAIKPTRKPVGSAGFKRFKNRSQEYEEYDSDSQEQKKFARNRQQNSRELQPRSFKQHNTPHQLHHNNNNNNKREKYGRNKSQLSTVSVSNSEPPTSTASYNAGKRYNSRRNKQQHKQQHSNSTPAPDNGGGFTRRGYKPKVQASTVDNNPSSSSLYKFKLNRSPGRWQYKTTPKPRVTIRKVNDEDANETTPPSLPDVSPALNDLVTPQARSDDLDGLVGSESVASIVDDESSTENKLDTPFPLETIKVEISTPPDFKDIYYEIATIKSPYTFQVGSVKNTRYITVTSTFEKSLEPSHEPSINPSATEPLTENILATTSNYDKDNNFLDSSIATLPPIYLAADIETPPLETLTDTFSTTQTMLKTHILPVIRGGNDTTSYTLVQTYLVTRLVTATKTLPPMEAYHFNPSKTLNEFNSHLDEAGSELHLELEFGDQNDQDDGTAPKRVLPGDLDLADIGSDFDLSSVDKSRIPDGLKLRKTPPQTTPKPAQFPEALPTPGLSPEQLQHLALLRLLNPAAAPQPQGQVFTASKPVVKVETVYESHVIPVINGQNTILSTLSKIIGTVTRTDYEYVTSTLPALPLPPVPSNPFYPQQQAQYAVTSSPVVQTSVLTRTESKILKLTFGAKTTHTTIFSTRVVPTVVTTYMTASVPVAPNAGAFPGFFPAPYPPFPYVG